MVECVCSWQSISICDNLIIEDGQIDSLFIECWNVGVIYGSQDSDSDTSMIKLDDFKWDSSKKHFY